MHTMTSPEELSNPCMHDVLSCTTILLSMLDNRDWATFKLLALKRPTTFQALANIIDSSENHSGVTFLHAAVRNDPPVDIIAEIIQMCPDSPRARDCLNRTPLHVAAGVGASAAVIKHLVRIYPEACNVQDEDGCTPLHFACDSECLLFEGDQVRRDPPDFEVVLALLSGSMKSVSMEDNADTSPLEYAIISNAELKVVKMLQKAAQLYMKKSHSQITQMAAELHVKKSHAKVGPTRAQIT
jgi:ankyrin repeat protein